MQSVVAPSIKKIWALSFDAHDSEGDKKVGKQLPLIFQNLHDCPKVFFIEACRNINKSKYLCFVIIYLRIEQN